jgi:hypothetical protein
MLILKSDAILLSAHLVGNISEFPLSRSKVGGESSSPG